MKPTAIFTNFSRKRKKGFALIVTLGLMILMIILVVGMLSLSTIELRRTTNSEAMSKARANARLAMMMAIGELQKELGPDHRISVPGGQKLAEGSQAAGKNWIGVYEAWDANTLDRPTPAFRRWLISGEESGLKNPDAAKAGINLASSMVTLVPKDTENDAVQGGVISMDGGNGYAWWVSDNNMKAKLGGQLTEAKEWRDAVARLQASPRAAHEPFIGSDVKPEDPRLGRILSVGTLDLLAPTNKSPRFHDATTLASGLVTNVRAGGFRKDLNFLLEKPLSEVPYTPLYKVGNSEGMNLKELWVDHNIWREVQTGAALTHADGSGLPAGVPYLTGPPTVGEAVADPFLKYRQLTRVQSTVVYSLLAKQMPATTPPAPAPQYMLYLVVDPIYTIWNPFNVAVQIPRSVPNLLATWAIPYDLKIDAGKKPDGTANGFTKAINYFSEASYNTASLGSSSAQNLVLRPGEVQIMSQAYTNTLIPGQFGNRKYEARLGWNFAAGIGYDLSKGDLKTVSGSPVWGKSGLEPITDPSTVVSFSLTGNTTDSHALAMMLSDHYLENGSSSFPLSKFTIDSNTIDPAGSRNGNKTKAKNFPDVFPTIAVDPSAVRTVSSILSSSDSDLTEKKWPIAVFTMGIRTELDPLFATSTARRTSRPFLRYNPKALGYDIGDLSRDALNENPMQVGMRRVNSSSSNLIEVDGVGLGYFGGDYGSQSGTSYIVSQNVPTSPLISLGALQHSLADGSLGASGSYSVKYLRPSVAHAISNSFAPSIMEPAQTGVTRGADKYQRDLADHSYLANRALWDDYFYSSIAPVTAAAYKDGNQAYDEQKERFSGFLGKGANGFKPLPNPRFLPWSENSDATLTEIFPSSKPVDTAAERVAAHLLIDGAFNVNSTSVAAWKAFFLGLKKSDMPVNEAGAPQKEPKLVSTEGTPIPANLIASGKEIKDSMIADVKNPEQWTGFRSLTDDQIDGLSKAVVKQVRLRGPFLSLSDFINRRPGNDKDLALSGALQSALDDNSVSINEPYREGDRSASVATASTNGFQFPEAEAGAKAAGTPGYVKQGDLLTSLAPLITVRGDTFTIRAYGEVKDPATGKLLARAHCEATVQRIPDFVDMIDAPYKAVNQLSPTNRIFGRQLRIVSYRFLSKDEV